MCAVGLAWRRPGPDCSRHGGEKFSSSDRIPPGPGDRLQPWSTSGDTANPLGSSRLHPAGDTWLVAHCPVSALVWEKPSRPAGPEPPGLGALTFLPGPLLPPPHHSSSLLRRPRPRSGPALLPGLCLPSLSPSLCTFEGTPSLSHPLPSSLTRQLGLGEVGG